MTKASLWVSDILHTPLPVVIRKGLDVLLAWLVPPGDLRGQTVPAPEAREGMLFFSPDFRAYSGGRYRVMCDKYLDHHFDLLGSGWVNAGYGDHAIGCSGRRYVPETIPVSFDREGHWMGLISDVGNSDRMQFLWKTVRDIRPGYRPVDWQRDMKSGFQFPGAGSSAVIRTMTVPEGADIKMPWELARLQHLPFMICVGMSAVDKEAVHGEAVCQLLDFIMSNPVGRGVNWSSAMDVAIRGANMAIVYDLLRSVNGFKDSGIELEIRSAIWHHMHYVWNHLEHKHGLGNNHYLANLAGILLMNRLYVANSVSFIPDVTRKFLKEVNKQFLTDGGNFESSVPYHFFSTEMAVYGLLCLDERQLGMKEKQLYHAVLVKIKSAVDMMPWLLRDTGEAVQFGDNDSGRFIKWLPEVEMLSNHGAEKKYENLKGYSARYGENGEYPDVNANNYSEVWHFCCAAFGHDAPSFYQSLLASFKLLQPLKSGQVHLHPKRNKTIQGLPHSGETFFRVQAGGESLTQDLQFRSFPEFGVHVFRNKRLHLVVNGMNRHVRQYWPHGHNDKLGFDLYLDGKALVVDPGSYVYTAFPGDRNVFRSVGSHAVVIFNAEEQNRWPAGRAGVFRMIPETKVNAVSFGQNSLKLRLRYRKYIHEREWIVEADGVKVIDRANKEFKVNWPPKVYSAGYGKRMKTNS